MKKFVIEIICFLCLFNSLFSQNAKYKFEYDASGNRIKRSFIVEGPTSPKSREGNPRVIDSDSSQLGFKESNPTTENKVYPNPTFGILNVEIYKAGTSSFVLVNSLGQFIRTGNLFSGKNTLDLTKEQRGNYFLKIIIASGEEETWKILKQ